MEEKELIKKRELLNNLSDMVCAMLRSNRRKKGTINTPRHPEDRTLIQNVYHSGVRIIEIDFNKKIFNIFPAATTRIDLQILSTLSSIFSFMNFKALVDGV